MVGCGASDIPKESKEASFNASVMAKCEACGNGISKQAEKCPGCRHPNPIPIAAAKTRADEARKLAQMEEKKLDEADTKRLSEIEAKVLADLEAQALTEMEANRRKKAANDASKQKSKPATTLLDLEVIGGEKPTTVIIARHPNPSFNGTYRAQDKLVNEKVYYKKGNDRHLYFYDQAEGGMKGWSLDHRKPDGKKDHYSGGWYHFKSFSHLDSNCDEWLDVDYSLLPLTETDGGCCERTLPSLSFSTSVPTASVAIVF